MKMPPEELEKLLKSVTKDCGQILEAIRRLREGTWHLVDEDADWASFLFPYIKRALEDHIEFETHCIFPGLDDDHVKEHTEEHAKISALLSVCDLSRLNKDSEKLHIFLDFLVTELNRHHEDFGCHLPRIDQCNDGCPSSKIIKRVQNSSWEEQ